MLGLQSISRNEADNVSHPRRLDTIMELIKYPFVLYLQHGRYDVKCKPSIEHFKHSSQSLLIVREAEAILPNFSCKLRPTRFPSLLL